MSFGADFLCNYKEQVMNGKLDITCNSEFCYDDNREIIVRKILSLKEKLILLERQLLDYDREQYHRKQERHRRSQMERKRIREDEAEGQKRIF